MDNYNRFEDPTHIAWAKKVKERDGFTCQICGDTNAYLNSHHCNSWDLFIDERFNVDNGVCLCVSCHTMFHNIMGHGRNTKFQFYEFKKFYNLIVKIARNHAKKNI